MSLPTLHVYLNSSEEIFESTFSSMGIAMMKTERMNFKNRAIENPKMNLGGQILYSIGRAPLVGDPFEGLNSKMNERKEPHNKLLKPTARGRHGPCLRKARAGDAPDLGFPAEGPSPVLAA